MTLGPVQIDRTFDRETTARVRVIGVLHVGSSQHERFYDGSATIGGKAIQAQTYRRESESQAFPSPFFGKNRRE
jgi:hypothetical protein